jgi:hypothetical protein
MACIDLRRALSRGGGEQIVRRPEFDVEMPVKMIRKNGKEVSDHA